ncbi:MULTISPECIES: hypothetical protein [unclassified Staphylococcus]|uniref:hypothetical protein n=1 Tax=unclassified Staphylococcus TaxID=91994 RepID=UPI00194F405F|nr:MULTISPECIES: hypothetical protein [unclassified Staphylococcus]
MAKVKFLNKKLEDILAFSMIFIIYAFIMFGSITMLNYIIQGKYKNLVTDNTAASYIFSKEKTLEYLGNIGVGISIICVILMIVATLFMILGTVNEWKNKQEDL